MQKKLGRKLKQLRSENPTIPAIAWLWKTCNQLKHKIFFWLLINNRLNTRELLQRKSFFTEDCTCVMCDQQVLETRDYLFFHRPLAKPCWQYICPSWSPLSVCRYSRSAQSDSSPAQSSICNGCHHTDCLGHLEHEECICFQKGVIPSLFACRRRFREELQWLLLSKSKKKILSYSARLPDSLSCLCW